MKLTPIDSPIAKSTAPPQPGHAPSAPDRSMTGYARVTRQASARTSFTLTLKSVNHRFLDLHFRLPSYLDAIELPLRKLLQEGMARGHVELTFSAERTLRGSAASIDRAAIASYLENFRSVALEFNLPSTPDLNSILKLPGSLTTEPTLEAEEVVEISQQTLSAAAEVIASLNAMRAQEGELLVDSLRGQMRELEAMVGEVSELRSQVRQLAYDRIRERVTELTAGAIDPERLMQEAALIAERSDIQEEVVRLETHVRHFLSLLALGGETGKKLDFLLQEMNREANTLLSKTNGVIANALRVTELGLNLKSVIEKAREQVQNLE